MRLCGLLLAALMGACAAPKVAPPPRPLAPVPVMTVMGGEWVAFAIDGVDEVVFPKPLLRWVSATQVSGSGGCNGFTGMAVSDLSRLRIGPLAATKMRCLSLPGGQEDKFFKALENTRTARFQNDQLVLLDDTGLALVRMLKAE